MPIPPRCSRPWAEDGGRALLLRARGTAWRASARARPWTAGPEPDRIVRVTPRMARTRFPTAMIRRQRRRPLRPAPSDIDSNGVSMKRWVLLLCVVIGIVLLIGVPYAINVYKMIQGFKHMPVQKETVSATKIGYQEWRPQLQAIGSLRAVRGADLSAEVAGIVDEIHFRSGDDVKAGDLLLTLRAADDLARLQALKATAALAETTYRRDQAQYEAQAISRQQLDSDEANLKAAQAQVVEQAALVAKKFVRAPFSGHLGLRAVDPGQYLAPGTKIVTLQQLDPIFVDFSLPQQSLGELAVGQSVDAVTDTFPGQHFAGRVDAIEPKVDTDTRNVQLRAELQNPQHRLLPGMYARVSIEVGQPQRYLTLPQTAVTYNPYGETV